METLWILRLTYALRWLIAKHYRRTALFLYLVLFPLVFPDIGSEGLRLQAKMAWRALWPRRWIRGSEPPGEPKLAA